MAIRSLYNFREEAVMDILIKWPKHYKRLPPGYEVKWVECVEHYMGFGPNEVDSPIYCNRFMARRWCYAHYNRQFLNDARLYASGGKDGDKRN